MPITIVMGDNEISVPAGLQTQQGMAWETNKPYPLRNVAQFMVVSRDRLRFHIQLEHKWAEYAAVKNWEAYLVDDKGRRYDPTEIDTTRNSHTSKMWDYERRVVTKNMFGDIVNINRMSGHLQRTELAGFTLYRGTGDIVFYSADLFTPKVKGLRLVLRHKTTKFEFAWRFDEDGYAAGAGRVVAIGYDLEQ